jgi:hypothetical protein
MTLRRLAISPLLTPVLVELADVRRCGARWYRNVSNETPAAQDAKRRRPLVRISSSMRSDIYVEPVAGLPEQPLLGYECLESEVTAVTSRTLLHQAWRPGSMTCS